MKNPIELILVSSENSNKFYRLIDTNDGYFKVEYGRVGASPAIETYPIFRWESKYKEKIKKGYIDVSSYKRVDGQGSINISDSDVKLFYETFLKYTSKNVSNNYTIKVDAVTQLMITDAQGILNDMLLADNCEAFNKFYLKLFTILPRKIKDVRSELVKDLTIKDKIIYKEQDILDSLKSQIDVSSVNQDATIKDLLNVDITPCQIPLEVEQLVQKTNSSNYKIYKCFKIIHESRVNTFNTWLNNQPNQKCEYLIHGTRNPNIFNILKSGLILRPTNVVISGAAYGEGIYHSAHTDKSLGYTGYDKDKMFLIQNVHMGNPYVYDGWYRDGKGISRSQMNYKYLNSQGYDSLYVKPGDGLRNSEYIVYNQEQTNTEYLLWMC